MIIYRSVLERPGYFLAKLKEAKEEVDSIQHLSAARIDGMTTRQKGKYYGGVQAYEIKKDRALEKYKKLVRLYLESQKEKEKAVKYINNEKLITIANIKFDCGATWSDTAFIIGMKTRETKAFYYDAFTNNGILKDKYIKQERKSL